MPAAAVIPAPKTYIKVVAVKKLVVGFLVWCAWPTAARCVSASACLPSLSRTVAPFTGIVIA